MSVSSNKEKIIKKYKNRRLYDLAISQYITMGDLQRYIMDGIPFRVIAADNEQDLTNATLLQIFVELEGSSTQLLSADMLRQLIVLTQHPMSESFKTMFTHMLTTLTDGFQTNAYQEFSDKWTQQMINQWQAMLKL